MLDSLTQDELDGKVALNQSRIVRVARGSGTSLKEVNDLMEEHKRLGKIVEKMGKMGLGKANDMMNLARNPGFLKKNKKFY